MAHVLSHVRLCDPMDCSPPGSSVHGISQARILEWVAISFSTIGIDISIITLNVNVLNAPTKRYRLTEWIQKQDPYICCLQETHFRPRDIYRLKVKGWTKIFHANATQKKERGNLYCRKNRFYNK